MQKQLHKFFSIIVFSLFLISPIQAADLSESYIAKNNKIEQMKLIHNDVKVNDLDIEPINTQDVKKAVVPDTKKESQKVMALFGKTMSAVALCAIILVLISVFVKKYYGSAFVNHDEEEYYEELDLSTPNNKQDALKSFLNRTK